MPTYPQYDLTVQYISESYPRVLQTIGAGQVLDGVGNTVFNTNDFVVSSQTSSILVVSASYSLTASYALNSGATIDSSSFITNSQTASLHVLSSSYAVSASWAPAANVDFSLYVLTSQTSSMSVATASYALNGGTGGSPLDTGSLQDVTATDFIKTRSGTITRDVNGRIQSINKIGGRTITLSRDGNNNITSATDGKYTYSYVRDINNKIISWAVI